MASEPQLTGDAASREEIVAMQLLAHNIVDLNRTILANFSKAQKDEQSKAVKSGKDGGAGIGDFLTKLTALLLPLSVLGSILSAFAPAFQLVGSAFKILGATLLPLVMPFFVVLATALLMLSDMLWDQIEPAIDSFYGWIFNTVIPALDALAKAFQDFIVFLGQLQGKTGQVTGPQLNEKKATRTAEENADIVRKQALKEGKSKEEADRLAGISRFGARQAGDADLSREVDRLLKAGMSPEVAAKREAERGKGPPAARGTSALGSMREVFAELRSSIGPKASFSGIADVSRNLQLSALNQSPFEAKILERMDKMLTAMEKAATNTATKPTARYDDNDGPDTVVRYFPQPGR